MAESKPTTDTTDTNPGNISPESTATNDTALADAAGITEGEVHALRQDAGLNQHAGHAADLQAWSVSPAGKAFADGEKDRQKASKEEEKSYSSQFNKDGLTEAEAKYAEVVDKA